MRFRQTHSKIPGARRKGGFTLAEVLAALLFMAIVIPVAMKAVQVASRAGEAGARKADACRIADRVLNELIATGGLQSAAQSGVVEEGIREYQWTMRSENWTVDSLNLVTVQVNYTVQGSTYETHVSTLVDLSQTTGGSTGTPTLSL